MIGNSAPGEANATSFMVLGLTNGEEYTFQVRAVNAIGPSAGSIAASATPAPAVSFNAASYTALEGQEAVTVSVSLSQGVNQKLVLPLRVTRPEATEVGDYTVEGLAGWDAQEGTGLLTFAAEKTKQIFTLTANHDGDGEDEKLTLGFGQLPRAVIPGRPAEATVTLEDKGLVALTVSFAQAEYTIMEGGEAARIEIRLSPAADRPVTVPLAVTRRGGVTRADYGGVPEAIVFEVGAQRTMMEVTALVDDVNDPGEGIRLSFGELPAAVRTGAIAQTTVHFTQDRLPEQFARSLEGMLAVVARTMGERAQTAIQGRFDRFRQWRRMRPAPEAAPPPKPGIDTTATGPRPRESAANGSPGRWQVSVGGWGRLISPGPAGAAAGAGVQPNAGSPGPARRDDAGSDAGAGAGLRPPRLSLAGTAFELSLRDPAQQTRWVPMVWGGGQRFQGELARIGLTYRGGLEAAQVGLDLYADEKLLAGLSFMRSWGDMDYTEDGTDGGVASGMNTVHPYLYWQPTDRVSVWGLGGVGAGHVAVREPGRAHDFEADFRMVAGGVRAMLTRQGPNEWGLRADAFTARLATDALTDLTKLSGQAHRGRVLLEWGHDRALSAGRSLQLTVEAGARVDGGDANRGSGLETGVRLAYLDATRGLDVALQGRMLMVHQSGYRDWGVGGQAIWDPGEPQHGSRMSVTSSLGQAGGGRTTLWDNAEAVTRPRGISALGLSSRFRIESEVAYGALSAFGLPGRLTPYGRVRVSGPDRELSVGSRLAAAPRAATGGHAGRPEPGERHGAGRASGGAPPVRPLLRTGRAPGGKAFIFPVLAEPIGKPHNEPAMSRETFSHVCVVNMPKGWHS